MSPADRQTQAQEAEYALPYHYLPEIRGKKFTSTRHWDWGFRYLGGMQVALDQLAPARFDSLIDIGCGDGRFLREAHAHYPGKTLLGIDASERAVRLAQALNPELAYRALDIVRDGLAQTYDAATLIEVIEHIPPPGLPAFLDAVAQAINPGGLLVLTVPHRNKPLIEKHYQHFTGEQLRNLLAPRFDVQKILPFDPAPRTPMAWLTLRMLGGKGRWFLFTQQRILYRCYRRYLHHYLYADDESRCERIAVVCTRR